MEQEFFRLDRIPANLKPSMDVFDICAAGALPICVLYAKDAPYFDIPHQAGNPLRPGYYQLPQAFSKEAAFSLKLGEVYEGRVERLIDPTTKETIDLYVANNWDGCTGIIIYPEIAFVYRPHLEKLRANDPKARSGYDKSRETSALKREKVLGAALALIRSQPDLCKNKMGDLQGRKIAKAMRKEGMWEMLDPDSQKEPPLGQSTCEDLVNRWLRRLEKS